MTFIEDFSKYILEKYPTNKDWADLCALTAIASSVSRETAIYTKMGPMRLNIFSLNIGPSRLAYKSTPLNYCLVPTLYSLGENLNKRFLLPARYSMEGLIEYMVEYSSQGCIIRDEFTSQFKDVKNKKYLAEGMEFLSELYDGLLQIRYTKSSKLEEVTKVYVSFIGAATPYIFSVMPRDFFMQGTGNRYLYVFSEPDEEEVIKAETNVGLEYGEMVEIDEEHMEFARRLAIIKDAAPRYISIQLGRAQKIYKEFVKKWTKKAFALYREDPRDIHYSYYANLKEFVLKISAIHCLSRNESMYDTFNENQLVVSKKDIDYAINKVNTHVDYFDKLMTTWGTYTPTGTAITDEPLERLILNNLTMLGPTNLSDLTRACHTYHTKISGILSGMVDNKLIQYEKKGTEHIYKLGKEKKSLNH